MNRVDMLVKLTQVKIMVRNKPLELNKSKLTCLTVLSISSLSPFLVFFHNQIVLRSSAFVTSGPEATTA
jgi:hypothetical protein